MTAGKVCRQPVVRKVMGLPGRRGSPSSGVTVGQGRMLKPSIEASGVQGTALNSPLAASGRLVA
jgi:hypothetical protein